MQIQSFSFRTMDLKVTCKLAAILFLHQCANRLSIKAITDNMPAVNNVFITFCVYNKAKDGHKPVTPTGTGSRTGSRSVNNM